ncbi:MAG: hypothetical protein PHC80_06835, partial [Eubacteriales bacterium]|nr:hypothetical protein [Eubacteriales bacterium]
MLTLFVLNAVIATTSKQQLSPLGVFYGAMLALLGFILYRGSDGYTLPDEKGRVFSVLRMRRLCAGLGAALCLIGVGAYVLIPQEYVTINAYHAMTRGVLMTAENPETALDAFSINEQYALLNKTLYYDDVPLISFESEQLQQEFYANYGFFGIATYYLTHPDSLLRMTRLAVENAWAVRPASLGNFAREAGFAPGAQTGFFTLCSTFTRRAMPRTVGFIVVWAATILACCRKDRGRLCILLVTVLMGLSQIVISIIGAGDADVSKHIFLFNVAFDLVSFVALAAALNWVYARVRAPGEEKKKRERRGRAKRAPSLPA